jgi:hypothetical protein
VQQSVIGIWSCRQAAVGMEQQKPTFVMAAVKVVLPWSTWPMVPIVRWGFT